MAEVTETTGCICPKFERTFEILGKKWNGLIIEVLLTGERRFKDLSAEIPNVSDRVLVERLRELEDCGIVDRTKTEDEHSSKIIYSLTKKGNQLAPVMDQVQIWAENWITPDMLD